IRNEVDKYARIFTFSVESMRNEKLKDVRQQWKHSRFFFGKNKVMSNALGVDSASEYKDNLHKVSQQLQGQRGLLMTNKKTDEVVEVPEFARSGNEATEQVILGEGPLTRFSHAMEPQLRQLGLPTSLKKGVIHLISEYTVCKKGETLTPEQCRILKLFDYQMATFHLTIETVWSNDGKFDILKDRSIPLRPTKVVIKPDDDGEPIDTIEDADESPDE
ncbi:unnamed protein product, partial [Owenia fusiformis]